MAMADDTKEPTAGDLLKNSSLYREFQAEREEILKHKWIESEKAGHDIGFERALTDWIVKHRSKWRKTRQSATHSQAINYTNKTAPLTRPCEVAKAAHENKFPASEPAPAGRFAFSRPVPLLAPFVVLR